MRPAAIAKNIILPRIKVSTSATAYIISKLSAVTTKKLRQNSSGTPPPPPSTETTVFSPLCAATSAICYTSNPTAALEGHHL